MSGTSSGLHPVYEQLVNEWEAQLEDLEKKVFQALRLAMPEGLTRRQLIHIVFGLWIEEGVDLNNNKYDRKIRKTIEKMRDDLIPIFSTSAEAGYKLDVSETSISLMVAEWQRRRDKYDEKIQRGKVLIMRIQQVGMEIPQRLPQQPKQIGLWS